MNRVPHDPQRVIVCGLGERSGTGSTRPATSSIGHRTGFFAALRSAAALDEPRHYEFRMLRKRTFRVRTILELQNTRYQRAGHTNRNDGSTMKISHKQLATRNAMAANLAIVTPTPLSLPWEIISRSALRCRAILYGTGAGVSKFAAQNRGLEDPLYRPTRRRAREIDDRHTVATCCRAGSEGWERYILIVPRTKEQAQTHLKTSKSETHEQLTLAEYCQRIRRWPLAGHRQFGSATMWSSNRSATSAAIRGGRSSSVRGSSHRRSSCAMTCKRFTIVVRRSVRHSRSGSTARCSTRHARATSRSTGGDRFSIANPRGSRSS